MDSNKKEQIYTEVKKLLDLPFVAGEYPVPVEKIVENLGFECHFFKPDSQTSNISGVVNHLNKKIFINFDDSAKRQQFTLAHEIGHIILHGTEEDYIDYRRPSASPKEEEANFFAANLVMPQNMFSFQWKSFNGNVEKLSQFFGVSVSAIAVRANALGLD